MTLDKDKAVLLSLFLILIVGGFLRFYNIEEKMRFIWDEARDMLAVHQMIIERKPTLFGPFNEIDGQKDFFGVFYYYLMAPSLYAADFDPVGPALFTALLGTLSILLVYWLLTLWTSKKMALAVAGLYAVSPLVIKYTQWPWNPNTTPFFGLLLVISGTKLYRDGKIHWSLLAGLLLGLLFQLHYFTIVMGIFWLIVIVSLAKNLGRSSLVKHALGFMGTFVLPNLSFIVFDLRHDYFYSRILIDSFAGDSNQKIFAPSLESLFFTPITFTHTLVTQLFFGNQYLGIVLGLILLTGIIIPLVIFRRNRRLTLEFMISCTLLLFLLMISLFPTVPHLHHAAPLFFGIIYLTILPITHISRFSDKFMVLAYFITIIALIYSVDVFRPPAEHENLPRTKEVSRIIVEDLESNYEVFYTIADLSSSDTRGMKYRYFLTAAGYPPMHVDKYPEAILIYLVSSQPADELSLTKVWETESFIGHPVNIIDYSENFYIYSITKQ